MTDLRGLSFLSIALIFLLRRYAEVVAKASDTVALSNDVRGGKFLLELGTNFSNPLLRLLGRVFEGYEDDMRETEKKLTEKMCQLHPCTEWESWTRCPVARGFSMVTRARNCNRNDGICSNKRPIDLPTSESKVCEGVCPETYNITGGYCMKLFTIAMAQYDAQAACEEDRGHLVNINTKAKSDAVHAVFKSYGITKEEVWINGNRSQVGSDWHFTYGAEPDFDNWEGSEPSNGSSELCKVDNKLSRVWYDRPCVDKYYYACEVV